MTHIPAARSFSLRTRLKARQASGASVELLNHAGVAHERARLSCRLRRVLAENPNARHFSVHHIIKALGPDHAAPSIALFSAAGVFEAPDTAHLSAQMTAALGAGLVLGRRTLALPRSLLRRRIPRNSLALLIHGVASMLDTAEHAVRDRWSWMFHPLMSGALGLTVFLLGLASMAPVIGGGVQHAASAFFVAVGMAERDGLVVMIGAVAGIASLALAALSIASGHKLWAKIKAWLLQCARRLHLDALADMLNHCCEGLGELMRMSWCGILLLMLSPVSDLPHRRRESTRPVSPLRRRAQRAKMVANLAFSRTAAQTHES
jgi:hypothetical protein